MNTATVAANVATPLIYGASLIVVIWCIVDVTRRPSDELARGKKTAWVVASLLGWLLFGIVGAAIAAFYLVGPRRKMNAERW
jgi:heme A synthase